MNFKTYSWMYGTTNMWSCYELGCRCRPSVNTIVVLIMIWLWLSSVSKHNMWSCYDWVVVVFRR